MSKNVSQFPYSVSRNARQHVTSWIPVSDQLPDHLDNVLIAHIDINGNKKVGISTIYKSRFSGDTWLCGSQYKVTHWMPLPEFPEEMN